MRKTSLFKKIIFIVMALGTITSGIFVVRAVNNRGAAPVAHWKFDEGSSNHAYDSSGNANTGTLTNMDTSAAWVNGEYGTALQFDGSNDYVSAGDIFYSNTLTISAWIYPTVLDANAKTIVAKRNNPGVTASTMEWFFYHSSSKLAFAATASGGVTDVVAFSGTSNLSLNTWQFASVTCDGSKCYMYLNGKLDGSGDQTGIIGDTASLVQIGARTSNNDNRYFTGSIDDVRIYNYARTADQVRADYNNGKALYVGSRVPASCDVDPASCVNKGLVGYWDMDQMAGTTATDKSGNGNTGTLGGGTAAYRPTWTAGIQPFSGGRPGGGALKFDGSDDYVDINSVIPSVASSTKGTISLYAKVAQLKDFNTFFGFTGGSGLSNHQLRIIVNSSGTLTALTYADAQKWTLVSDNPVISINTWYHIVLVQDGTSPVIYINGNLIPATFTFSNDKTYWFANNPFDYARIGTMALSSSEWMNGLIDDVRIYNRALSATEIRYQYNQAKPIALWKFNEGSGNYAYDSSGNGNTGSLVLGGSATSSAWVSGVYGSALQFDGSNDYVSINGNPDLLRGSRTYELWFYPHFNSDSGGVNYMFLSRMGDGDQIALYNWSNGFYGLAYAAGGSVSYISAGSFTANNWYHITVTFDDDTNQIKVYHNGVLQNEHTESNAMAAGTVINKIGMYVWNGWFNGLIDDVKIYNYARTADQVRNDYNDGKALYVGVKAAASCDVSPADCVNKGLVGYWDMDQMGGTTAADKSGNGNTGTLGGGVAAARPTWTTGIQPFSGGRAGGGALQFDGVDDYVGTNAHLLSNLSAVTVCFWAKPTATNKRVEVSEGTDTTTRSGYGLAEDGNVYILPASTGSYGYANWSTLGVNNFIYFCGVYDGTQSTNATKAKIYLNGTLQTLNFTGTIPSSVGSFTGTTEIGRRPTGIFYSTGLIDDVRIYNRALSAAEIRYQYNQAKPIAWWKMDSVGVSGAPGAALNVYDNSGQGNTGVSSGETMNNGTISGATVKSGSSCKYGACLYFDASSDYIDGSISLGAAYSVEGWVKIDSTYPASNGRYLICFGAAGGLPCVSPHYYDGNKPLIYLGGSNYAYGTSNLNDGAWHHIVFVITGSGQNDIDNAKIYIDGAAQTTSVYKAGSPSAPAGVFRIGAGNYKGYIDNLRVYNVALTADQALALYRNNDRSAGASLEGNLVGEWRFDESAASYVADTHYQRIGKYNYALNFDGSDDYVNAGNGSSIHPTKYITISVWVKPGSTQVTYADIAGNHAVGGGWNGYTMQQSGSTLNLFGFSYGNGSTWQGGTVLTQLVANQWNHYVVQKNDTVLKSYLNGVLVGQENVTGDIVYAATHPIYIGVGYTGLTRYFNGLIDDVRIYNYARTADQIKQDYNQGAAVRFGPLEGLP